MALAFILSMPHSNAANGRWSGSGKCCAIVRPVGRSNAAKERATKILADSPFYYNFGDGWAASVSVREVDDNETKQLRRQTLGFYGYSWMVDSILAHGVIKRKGEV